MRAGLEVRPATAADLPALVEIYNQCEDFLSLGSDQSPGRLAALDFEDASHAERCFCLLEQDGQPAGVLDFSPHEAANEAHIHLLMLAKPYRRNGLGQAVVHWLLAQMQYLPGFRSLRAEVQVELPEAQAFWLKQGFQGIGAAARQADGTTTLPLRLTLPKPYIRYTLCFLQRGAEVLLIHRRRPPNQGLWNGLGGHLETGESALQGALREIQEETGLSLGSARFAGLLTWEGFETPPGGLAMFVAPAPEACQISQTDEGELAWKPLEWLYQSPEVVSNLHTVAPLIFDHAPPQIYHFYYDRGQEIGNELRPLPFFFPES